MNNQVKLISTDVLIQELKKRINQLPESRIHLGGYHTGKKNAYEVMIEFLKIYNPDTPPVPTIKPGDKVRHKNIKELGEGEVTETEVREIWARVNFGGIYSTCKLEHLEVVE